MRLWHFVREENSNLDFYVSKIPKGYSKGNSQHVLRRGHSVFPKTFRIYERVRVFVLGCKSLKISEDTALVPRLMTR